MTNLINLKNIGLSLAVMLLVSSADVFASGGPQVLPSMKSDRARFYKPIPAEKELVGHSSDPYETLNRGAWTFNYDYLDKYGLRPVAHGYLDIMPEPVVDGVHNILENLREVNNTVNNLAIAEFGDSLTSVGRFAINSTIGILGFFDVAKHMGLERKRMKFSTVLGKWGMNNGPYMQVPFVAMQTPRNILGTVVDNIYLPYGELGWGFTIGYTALNILDTRAQLVKQEDLIDGAFDPYLSARDFYLQYEDSLVVGKDGFAEAQQQKDLEDQKNLDSFMDEIDE